MYHVSTDVLGMLVARVSGKSLPAKGVIGILLTQRLMDSPQPPRVFTDFWTCAYAAVE
jgi:hypothetical protein